MVEWLICALEHFLVLFLVNLHDFVPHKLLLGVDFFSKLKGFFQKAELVDSLASPESVLCVVKRVNLASEQILDFVRLKKALIVVVENVVFFGKVQDIVLVRNNERAQIFLVLAYHNGTLDVRA